MPLWRNYSGQTVIRALNFFTAFGLFFEGYNQGVMAVSPHIPFRVDIVDILGCEWCS